MATLIAYLALGTLAGILAGLLGIGGGIVIVPGLYFLFLTQGFPEQICMHLAIGSSLASVVFTSMSSASAHHRRGSVHWTAVRGLTPGLLAGAALGAALADLIPERGLRLGFGLFEIAVAVQLLVDFEPAPHRDLPRRGVLGLTGALIGMVSALLGIGGGTLTVPFLLWCNVSMHPAVGTSAACGLPIALAGALGFVITGWDGAGLPPRSSGYLYWPAVTAVAGGSVLFAPLGARLGHTLPVASLKRLFALVVAVIGIRILI
ncbi:MAG: sulfite exporter TauE/SafE family protein [Gammaproteobacteria bacterium]